MNLEELKIKFWNQIVNNDFNVSQAKEDLILQGMNKEIYLRSNFLEIVKNYKDSGYYLSLLKQYHNLIKIDELWDREYFMIYQKKVVFLSYDDLKNMYFKEKVNV